MTSTQHATTNNTSSSSSSMDSVMNDRGLLQGILSFLPDTFRFTAAVSRLFRQRYLETHNNENKYRTSFRNALQAIGTARIWAAEIPQLVFWEPAGSYLEVCDWAAAYGTLDVLKDLRANQYAWSTKTCSNAAERGDLDVLKWAREHGCPWDEDCCDNAAYGGHGPLKYFQKRPSLAAEEHVLSFHGQPFPRSHFNSSKWPLDAAAEHVASSHGQPFSRAHFGKTGVPGMKTLALVQLVVDT